MTVARPMTPGEAAEWRQKWRWSCATCGLFSDEHDPESERGKHDGHSTWTHHPESRPPEGDHAS